MTSSASFQPAPWSFGPCCGPADRELHSVLRAPNLRDFVCQACVKRGVDVRPDFSWIVQPANNRFVCWFVNLNNCFRLSIKFYRIG